MEEVSNNNTSKIADSNDYDIYLAQEYINTTIPISAIFFPEAEFPITFYQTRGAFLSINLNFFTQAKIYQQKSYF